LWSRSSALSKSRLTRLANKASMNITVLVVDDEPAARRRLCALVEGDPEIGAVHECGDGIRAAEMIQQLNPDLIFLDIQMPGADGFSVLEEAAGGQLPTVVFVTAHREYAVAAFEVQAFDYLLKPFKRSRFLEVLNRAKTQIRRNGELQRRSKTNRQQPSDSDLVRPASALDQSSELLLIKSGARLLFLKMAEIKWIEAERDYVRLHLEKESHLIRDTMDHLYRKLDKNGFIRIHRSTIVNVKEICEIQPLLGGDYRVFLRDKTQLTLSRRYRRAFDEFLRLKVVNLPKSV
jgi:two-component system, LytTR family, response regulator